MSANNPLRIVQPFVVTDTMLVSSTVPEADHAAWSAVTSYAQGARCILTTGVHKVYESLIAGNLNKPPQTEPLAWAEVGPTNRWRLFDTSNSTQTAQSTALSYTLRPVGAINAVALLNVRGVNSVRVRLTHPIYGTIYDKTTDLASLPGEAGWWAWFFGGRTAPKLLVLTDLPGLLGCDLIVDVAGTTELAVGVLMCGELRSIGIAVQQGARVGIQDYSRKETNDFGDAVLVQRAFAKRASFDLPILAGQVDEVIDYLSTIRAVPCLWIGSALYGATVIFGFYKEFDVNIAYRAVSECSLQIEGLT